MSRENIKFKELHGISLAGLGLKKTTKTLNEAETLTRYHPNENHTQSAPNQHI